MSPFAAMTTANVVIGILFIIVAVVLVVLGGVAAAGKLPGNGTIGLRVPEVRKHESTWRQAHQVVGPFWILAGVAMALGAAFAFISHGWLWVAPVIAVVAAVVSLSVGGNFGARAAALVDATITAQNEHQTTEAPTDGSAGSGAGGAGAAGSGTEGAAPKPAVDLDALRRAAGEADKA